MRFVLVACWKLDCVDFCYGLEACWGRFFVVLGVLWGRFLVFWELVELIFGAWEALSGFSGSRTRPRDHLGSILECFGAHVGGTWEVGVVLLLCCNFLEIFLVYQIHPYLQGVSEAILGDLTIS